MTDWLHAGTWEELQEQGAKVIKGGIAVFVHADEVYAVDNRCPHMGFPLHMGSLCDGILTCHWHHARFDVCSGGTLDPWADDVPVHRVKVEQGSVWVDPRPQVASSVEKQLRRLREGMEQNLSLVIAKSVVALVESGVPAADIARVGVEFGTTYRSAGWSSGLTILAAMVNVLPKLDKYGRILALYHGLARVARDCAGQPARFLQQPLPETEQQATEHLSAWYRRCMEVRDIRGAERVLASAIASGLEPNELMSMMMIAVTDHFYMDGGHTLDFHNKAFEILQHIGSDSAVRVLSSLVPLPARSTRSEELQHWQSPVNLVDPLRQAFRELEGLTWSAAETPASTGGTPQQAEEEEQRLLALLLGDQPLLTIEALTMALRSGRSPVRLAQLVALAAAERITRFHTQNEFGDWITVLHTFTHAHAVHETLRRSANVFTVRAIYYAAVTVYLDRFLNVPAARLPNGEHAEANPNSTDPGWLLKLLDRQQQVAEAGEWLAQYLHQNGDIDALFNTLGHALLREDAEFHSYQMYEAASAEYDRWDTESGPLGAQAKQTMLLALTRYLAAHSPTARELPHTARIAWRLHRGEKLFEE